MRTVTTVFIELPTDMTAESWAIAQAWALAEAIQRETAQALNDLDHTAQWATDRPLLRVPGGINVPLTTRYSPARATRTARRFMDAAIAAAGLPVPRVEIHSTEVSA